MRDLCSFRSTLYELSGCQTVDTQWYQDKDTWCLPEDADANISISRGSLSSGSVDMWRYWTVTSTSGPRARRSAKTTQGVSNKFGKDPVGRVFGPFWIAVTSWESARRPADGIAPEDADNMVSFFFFLMQKEPRKTPGEPFALRFHAGCGTRLDDLRDYGLLPRRDPAWSCVLTEKGSHT